jgi:hypothetical protein
MQSSGVLHDITSLRHFRTWKSHLVAPLELFGGHDLFDVQREILFERSKRRRAHEPLRRPETPKPTTIAQPVVLETLHITDSGYEEDLVIVSKSDEASASHDNATLHSKATSELCDVEVILSPQEEETEVVLQDVDTKTEAGTERAHSEESLQTAVSTMMDPEIDCTVVSVRSPDM